MQEIVRRFRLFKELIVDVQVQYIAHRKTGGDLSAAERLGDGPFHGGRDAVRIHDDFAVRVPRGAADGLNERGLGTEEALFVGISALWRPVVGSSRM